jgi:hypothetical protein
MLSSITPLGERSRNQRYAVAVAWYVLGSIAGGATFGLLFGSLGHVLETMFGSPPVAATLIAIAAIAAMLDGPLRHTVPLPTIRRQVNEDWLTLYRNWVYGVGFGVQLGAGLLTIVTSWLIYAMVTCLLVIGDVRVGLLTGFIFGLVRALPILAGSRVTSTGRLLALHQRINATAGTMRWVCSAAVLGSCGAAILIST